MISVTHCWNIPEKNGQPALIITDEIGHWQVVGDDGLREPTPEEFDRFIAFRAQYYLTRRTR